MWLERGSNWVDGSCCDLITVPSAETDLSSKKLFDQCLSRFQIGCISSPLCLPFSC